MAHDLNLSMFRAYDIRTPASDLPPELARRLAAAAAVYFRDELGVSGVLVAHDARRTGPQYLSLAADVYRAAGLEVIHLRRRLFHILLLLRRDASSAARRGHVRRLP